nr:zinc finger protein 37-like isoform X2 [Parasteatoda tepidariorum]
MSNTNVDSRTDNSEYRLRSLLGIAKLFTKTPSKNGNINIKEEMLAIQNSTDLDVSGQDNNNIKVTSCYQMGKVIKKEKVNSEKSSDFECDRTVNLPKKDPRYEVITSDLKREPGLVNTEENPNGLNHSIDVSSKRTIYIKQERTDSNDSFIADRNETLSKGNLNRLANHREVNDISGRSAVSLKQERSYSNDGIVTDKTEIVNKSNVDVSGKRTVYLKQESDSKDGFISAKAKTANETNNIAFFREKINDKTCKRPCSEDIRIVYDMDEQYDSFNEQISISEEEVHSSDIEEMFSEKKINENDRSLDCLVCGKHFKLKQNLQKHALSHLHDGSEVVRKFECEICGKKFKKKHHLKRHNLSHTQKKMFDCAHCDKSYIDKHDLMIHLSSKHTVKECTVCGKTFDDSLKFKKHQVIHKKCESQAVSCHICQKSFLQKKYLKRHLQQIHAKMAPFACDQCNKSFLYPFLLLEHSRSHSGEKPFQCDKCDRKFSTKSNQVRHSKTHLKTKTCKNCTAEFEDDIQYKAHQESCTLSYECGICGLICDRLSNLRRHIKNIHTEYSNPNAEGPFDSSNASENIFVRIV